MNTLKLGKTAPRGLKNIYMPTRRAFSYTSTLRAVEEVTSVNQFKDLIADDKVAIVDFYATWCGPCKAIEPVMEKLSERVPQASFLRVDVDQQAEIAKEYGITAMPTIKFYKDGEVASTVVGANLKAIIDSIKTYTGVDLMKKEA
ncbi:mitochondrial thioredoxin [Yamadazyma tenuis]|nr:mitochondrial thioredoxin [Yamadazyma tenuis]